jgi:hypothetical protein
MIRPSEISKLAHQLGLGDKTIEKDYMLTWVLLALADSPLCDLLAFKGGTAIKKMYIPDYRFSEDLDFTLLDASLTNGALQTGIEALFPWLKREVNLTLATRKVEVHSSGNPALYLNCVGPCGFAVFIDFHDLAKSGLGIICIPGLFICFGQSQPRPLICGVQLDRSLQAWQCILMFFHCEEGRHLDCAAPRDYSDHLELLCGAPLQPV